jgi:hypothetical protein
VERDLNSSRSIAAGGCYFLWPQKVTKKGLSTRGFFASQSHQCSNSFFPKLLADEKKEKKN